MRFALTGAAGYIAPRHMKAIRDLGHELVVALDPHDAVGVLDAYAPDCQFFASELEFWMYLRRHPVDWVAICSPNFRHTDQARLALETGARVLCEKPLAISSVSLDELERLDGQRGGGRVFTVLNLRRHPAIINLREYPTGTAKRVGPASVRLDYATRRGQWYDVSWKADHTRSGGLMFNLGIHLFDALLWLYGPLLPHAGIGRTLVTSDGRTASGELHLAGADVTWSLSSRATETRRSMLVDGIEVDFTSGFTELHTDVYRETLAGRGFGVADARPAVELVERLRRLAEVKHAA